MEAAAAVSERGRVAPSHARERSGDRHATAARFSNPAPAASREPPAQWTRLQDRARALHAWEAKCGVEEVAVRSLEVQAQADMEAVLGRKAALMEELQHLCREDALLREEEAAVKAEEENLYTATSTRATEDSAADAAVRAAASTNARRRRELQEAHRGLEQTQLRHAESIQCASAELDDLEAAAADAALRVDRTAHRLMDLERRLARDTEGARSRELERLAALEHHVRDLLCQLESGAEPQ
ncbi:hypothetical protein NESM_000733500 [Novymonas esmeraldas]|uniref:KfrA N-terminal DNA-binding domain-containing protein n=1 Tax=Novymonas esmeraldas TaxID=1808958 RepID=A0AAW0EY37_9TRYP